MELVLFYEHFPAMVKKTLADFLPQGHRFSLPVAYLQQGRLHDALYIYDPQKPEFAPESWLLADSATGALGLFCSCAVMDFAASDLAAPKDIAGYKKLSSKKEAQLLAKICPLYEQVRTFAFTEKLNREQATVVAAYKELFLKLVVPEQYPFYYALSPEYFHWLRLPLPTHKAKAKGTREDAQHLLMLENLRQLANRFEQKIQTDVHRQKLFDQMHAELQEYKNGLLDQLTLSMERDVIRLIDDVEKNIAVFADMPPTKESYGKMLNMLAGFATDLQDLLYRHGIDPYNETGDAVNVQRQQIISTVVTSKQKLDKKTAARLSPGWEKQGKVIRPERISVYLYQEEAAKDE